MCNAAIPRPTGWYQTVMYIDLHLHTEFAPLAREEMRMQVVCVCGCLCAGEYVCACMCVWKNVCVCGCICVCRCRCVCGTRKVSPLRSKNDGIRKQAGVQPADNQTQNNWAKLYQEAFSSHVWNHSSCLSSGIIPWDFFQRNIALLLQHRYKFWSAWLRALPEEGRCMDQLVNGATGGRRVEGRESGRRIVMK